MGLEPVDPFSATRVGNDTNPVVVPSNDHDSNDDKVDDNSSGDDDIQEFNERYLLHKKF